MVDATPKPIPPDLREAAEKELEKSGRQIAFVAIFDRNGNVETFVAEKGKVEGGDVEVLDYYKEPVVPHKVLKLAFTAIGQGDQNPQYCCYTYYDSAGCHRICWC